MNKGTLYNNVGVKILHFLELKLHKLFNILLSGKCTLYGLLPSNPLSHPVATMVCDSITNKSFLAMSSVTVVNKIPQH